MATTIRGKDVLLSVDGVTVGCASSAEFTSDVSMESAACRESGDYYDAVPGIFEANLSLSGFVKYDEPADATRVRAWDLFELHKEKVLVDWVFATPGAPKGKSGKGYIINYTETGEQEGSATYSVNIKPVGVYDTVATPDITAPLPE